MVLGWRWAVALGAGYWWVGIYIEIGSWPFDKHKYCFNRYWFYFSGIKTRCGWVYCHNARGRVRNRKSNPEGVTPRDLTYCLHKPECIVTTNPDRSVLIPIITWHFQFRPVNVSILHLKYDCRAWSESRFACYSHCYVTWYPLTTGIVASQCP